MTNNNRVVCLIGAFFWLTTVLLFGIKHDDMSKEILKLKSQQDLLKTDLQSFLDLKSHELELQMLLATIQDKLDLVEAKSNLHEKTLSTIKKSEKNRNLQNSCINDNGSRVMITDCTVIINGGNLMVRNGKGVTEMRNGKGNIIIGYNEPPSDMDPGCRKGSHNLIVGAHHEYHSHSGIVSGYANTIAGSFAAVVGGDSNIASGIASSVLGGQNNKATGEYAAVSGGSYNEASGNYASVSGGDFNSAMGLASSVSGGEENIASGDYSSISGGGINDAKSRGASVSGGAENYATGEYSSILGGKAKDANGVYSTLPAIQ